jgi:two-component system response regulator YesN
MRGYTAKDWTLLLYALENIAEETVDEWAEDQASCGWVWQEPPRRCWMLLRGNGDAELLAEKIRAAASRNLRTAVTVAVGRPFAGLTELRQSRNDVLALLHKRLIEGGNRVYAADRLPPRDEAAKSDRPRQIGHRVRLAIRQPSREDALRLMREAWRELESLASHEAIEQAVQAALLQIAEAWTQVDPGRGRQFIAAESARVHDDATSFARLCGRLEEWALEAADALRALRAEAGRSPVEKAREWIREHLAEPLTIAMIAERIPMHPTYFCEVFKTQTGETVLDYITRVRMEEAARLLRETDCRLAEVAERVGYRDIKHFRSQFKKLYGVLPSRYKEIDGDGGIRLQVRDNGR